MKPSAAGKTRLTASIFLTVPNPIRKSAGSDNPISQFDPAGFCIGMKNLTFF